MEKKSKFVCSRLQHFTFFVNHLALEVIKGITVHSISANKTLGFLITICANLTDLKKNYYYF